MSVALSWYLASVTILLGGMGVEHICLYSPKYIPCLKDCSIFSVFPTIGTE